jgi:hypothetical protein
MYSIRLGYRKKERIRILNGRIEGRKKEKGRRGHG